MTRGRPLGCAATPHGVYHNSRIFTSRLDSSLLTARWAFPPGSLTVTLFNMSSSDLLLKPIFLNSACCQCANSPSQLFSFHRPYGQSVIELFQSCHLVCPECGPREKHGVGPHLLPPQPQGTSPSCWCCSVNWKPTFAPNIHYPLTLVISLQMYVWGSPWLHRIKVTFPSS